MEKIQTVTIFRSWVALAATLKADADRGKLYHAICEYALDGKSPDLPPHLQPFFIIIQPTIDKSQKRKMAQQKGCQNRLQSGLQNDVQNDVQTDVQTDAARAYKTGTGTKKKSVTKVTPKEKISFAILLPDHLQCSDVAEKWKEWENYRRSRGKPISKAAAQKQMKMLAELDRKQAIAAIDYSIANDYQGLFPPRSLMRGTSVPGTREHTGI